MKKFFITIIKIFALFLFYFSYLFPRKKNRWLFGEAHGFNNNSKYLYLDIIENHPEIDPIWIGEKRTVRMLRAMGLPAFYRYSLKGIYLCLCSKVYIVSWSTSDISFYLSGGALVVNLWHGLAWKKCLWLHDSNYDKLSQIQKIIHFINKPGLHLHPHIVLSTSSFYTDIFAKTFRVGKDCCIQDIYPRVKFMLKPREEIINHLIKYSFDYYLSLIKQLSCYKRVFLYAPTFRDTGEDFIINSGLDFIKLDKMLQNKSYFMIVKFHPSTKYDCLKYSKLKNIIFLNKEYDLNILMPFTDILITDYSTTLVDYLLLRKMIIAFIFDYEQYISKSRELLFPYEDCIKGIPIANNSNELIKIMFSDQNRMEVPKELIKRYWESSDDLIETIKKKSQTNSIRI